MKKILVPVDFSSHTDITCSYALEIAKMFGAEIRLFHTYFDQIIVADSSFPESIDMSTLYNEELLKEILHQAERNLEELHESLQEKIRSEKIGNVTLSKTLTGGDIEMELITVCNEYEPDLVIMGTKGKGNSVQVWGRFSTYLINHVSMPVMTIPDIKKNLGFNHLMFSADLSDSNVESIRTILKLMAPFQFHIHCVHFSSKGKVKDEESKLTALKDSISTLPDSAKISVEVVDTEGDNQKAIDNFVKENKISLIAFQPHKRSLLYTMFTRNITKKNLFSVNLPLLAIPGRK
jgi:nucleotide-binding universal stress UspA family protein